MQRGMFGEENHLEMLSKLGDALERLNKAINWEAFRPILTKALRKERKGAGGRPPYDVILMFKILILQRLYNFGDDQTEYLILDRLSFMRFLGINLDSPIPDAKTIWFYKDTLAKAGTADKLFAQFERMLEESGLISRAGTIVDATFVDAPKQRNSREENTTLKEGGIPEEWQKLQNAHKLAQKDTDARWAKKHNETHYGYKNHVKADKDSKLITGYAVTDASVHDSRALPGLIDEKDKVLYADSAYRGKELLSKLPETVEIQVHEKAYRNRPLTDAQKEENHRKSKIRFRIEHIFGFMTNSMNGITVRSIGIVRAKFNIAMMNLAYNMCRYEFLRRTTPVMG